MAISTSELATRLQQHINGPGGEALHQWLEGMRQDVLALAQVVDADRGTGTAAVDALTNIKK